MSRGTSGESAWKAGRLDDRPGPAQLLFGRMYEDASIERGVFPPGGRIFSIASAGCTARALACGHDVVAVDLNPLQLDYARRRLAGAPAEPGQAERVIGFGRTLAPLVGWTRARLRHFLALEAPAAQVDYWNRVLNTPIFRGAFDALLSAGSLARIYSPNLVRVLPRPLGPVLRARMERCFSRHPNRRNPYARALFLGELPNDPPPACGHRIELACADAAAYLEASPAGHFDGFTLSNVLDGADSGYAGRLAAAVERAARPGANVVLRSFREPPPRYAAPVSDLAPLDRSMLWGRVEVRPARHLCGFLDVYRSLATPGSRPAPGTSEELPPVLAEFRRSPP